MKKNKYSILILLLTLKKRKPTKMERLIITDIQYKKIKLFSTHNKFLFSSLPIKVLFANLHFLALKRNPSTYRL